MFCYDNSSIECPLDLFWTYIESLGLSAKNHKWLADKLIEMTKSRTKDSTSSSSLRNAFSGNWESDVDSVSYAQMLREETQNILQESIV